MYLTSKAATTFYLPTILPATCSMVILVNVSQYNMWPDAELRTRRAYNIIIYKLLYTYNYNNMNCARGRHYR